MNELINGKTGTLVIAGTQDPALPHPFEQEIYLLTVRIAGMRYVEGIDELSKQLEEKERVQLYRECDNVYDPYAISVSTQDGTRIGWVPRVNNRVFARLMDAGKQLYGEIKDIEFAEASIPEVSIRIFLHEL